MTRGKRKWEIIDWLAAGVNMSEKGVLGSRSKLTQPPIILSSNPVVSWSEFYGEHNETIQCELEQRKVGDN